MKFEDVKGGMEVRVLKRGEWCEFTLEIGDVITIRKISGLENAFVQFDYNNVKGMHIRVANVEPVTPVKHKFHVGQPVRVTTNAPNSLCHGNINIITEIGGDYYVVETKNGYCNKSTDYKHIEPAYALEVGCKVRVVDYTGMDERFNGMEGCIVRLENPVVVKVYEDNSERYFDAENLIVIEPAPEKSIGIAKEDIEEGDMLFVDSDGNWAVAGKRNDNTDRYRKMIETSISMFATGLKTYGGNEMKKENYEKLAKKMNDEYVGNGFDSIFLKKAGECSVEVRDVTITLTPSDIEAILKEKGISKALGTFEMDELYQDITVKVVKFTPIESKKKSKKNEAD